MSTIRANTLDTASAAVLRSMADHIERGELRVKSIMVYPPKQARPAEYNERGELSRCSEAASYAMADIIIEDTTPGGRVFLTMPWKEEEA